MSNTPILRVDNEFDFNNKTKNILVYIFYFLFLFFVFYFLFFVFCFLFFVFYFIL
tara:strand:+ start:178 stop:342 length:165 start_codon:yes stop_codon:yes gene_type:complete